MSGDNEQQSRGSDAGQEASRALRPQAAANPSQGGAAGQQRRPARGRADQGEQQRRRGEAAVSQIGEECRGEEQRWRRVQGRNMTELGAEEGRPQQQRGGEMACQTGKAKLKTAGAGGDTHWGRPR